MGLKSVTQLNVDFSNKKYISINAKQNDKESRFLEITCYDQGKLFPINNAEHFAYVRYKKADDYGVFNECEIKGNRILVELTEQMLAAEGVCYADLVIVNRGSAEMNHDTGEIVFINNTGILSTMTFCINVFETAIENSEFESTYEFDNLNRLLDRADADYQDVITTSRDWAKTSESWAVGETGTRNGENTNNAKYYANNAESFKNSSNTSATKAAASEAAALSSEQNAKISENKAEEYSIKSQSYAVGGTGTREGEDVENAKYYYEQSIINANNSNESKQIALDSANVAKSYAVGGTGTREGEDTNNTEYYYRLTTENKNASFDSATAAADSAEAAASSEANAKTSETNAKLSEANAKASETNAKDSENIALDSASSANASAESAEASEIASRGYSAIAQDSMNSAIDSAVSASESATNAHNYYLQTEAITNGLNGAFLPKGTITFAELLELKNNGMIGAGDLYHISDNFTTDENFRISGKVCGAGTSVYYTVDDEFDCFVGTTVSGVKGKDETEYRTGMVNITPENIGAVAFTDVATTDEVKNYLGI